MTTSSSSPHYTIRLLGGFQLSADGKPLSLPSKKAQVLLAYLAQRSGQPVSRGKIASMLWAGGDDHEARHSLRQCLLVLRKSLGEAEGLLGIEQESIWLNAESVRIDTVQFEQLVGEEAEGSMRDAISLYRGEFLEGMSLSGEPIHEWITFERRRLGHLMKKSLSGLLTGSRTTPPVDEAISIATRLLAIDPTQLDIQQTLSRLYGGGERSERCVLVAARDEIVRRRLADALRGAGYEARLCADGADLLIGIGAGDCDMVVVDIDLPILGGLELVRTLTAKRPDLPVVCIGDGVQEREAEGLALGAADFLEKPVQKDVLLLRVENIFRGRTVRQNSTA